MKGEYIIREIQMVYEGKYIRETYKGGIQRGICKGEYTKGNA